MTQPDHFHPSTYCAKPVAVTEPPVTSASRLRRRFPAADVGYLAVFIMAIVFLSVGATTLWAMTADVTSAKRQATEAARPADIEIVTLVVPGCAQCYTVTNLTGALAQSTKVNVTDSRTVDYSSPEGQALVQKYGLTRVPAFIVTGETTKLLQSLASLSSYGRLAGQDFVGTNLPAPFVEAASGKLRGEFQATYITEKKCPECYDPTINRQALEQLGLRPAAENTVDRSDPEGRRLVKKYAITSAPTVILTGDIEAYTGFDKIWANVGTIEPDGAYVFRQGQSLMGTSYDLTTGKVVPKKTETNTNTSNP